MDGRTLLLNAMSYPDSKPVPASAEGQGEVNDMSIMPSISGGGAEAGRVPPELFLLDTSPSVRREIVLELVAAHGASQPDHSFAPDPLFLNSECIPRQRGLPTHLPREARDAPRIDLQGAMLRGVNLEGVDLRGINLAGACLVDSLLRGADLRGACLEAADLSGADLASARLDGATLEKAHLSGATCEDASFRGVSLRFVEARKGVFEGADLQSAELWGADFGEAVFTDANLRGAVIRDADFRAADLSRARFEHAVIGPANFDSAVLTGADLRGALITKVSLRRAVLTDSLLTGVFLTACPLEHACLAGAALEGTRLNPDQLGNGVGEELAADYGQAARSYLALEKCFNANGDHTSASWAYRKRRRMQKLASRSRGRVAIRQGHWREAVGGYSGFVADVAAEWLCDYGESVPRVLATMLTVYLVFALVYAATGSMVRVEERAGGPVRVPTSGLTDAAIFSLMAMTTSGSPVVVLQPASERVHILTGTQALLGIGLAGLLGFVLGNRIHR